MKALVGAFNQEKALVGAFSVIVKTGCGTDGSFYSTTQKQYEISTSPDLHQEARSSQISGLITASRNELTKSQEELLRYSVLYCTVLVYCTVLYCTVLYWC